jgi:hypothetical protein
MRRFDFVNPAISPVLPAVIVADIIVGAAR